MSPGNSKTKPLDTIVSGKSWTHVPNSKAYFLSTMPHCLSSLSERMSSYWKGRRCIWRREERICRVDGMPTYKWMVIGKRRHTKFILLYPIGSRTWKINAVYENLRDKCEYCIGSNFATPELHSQHSFKYGLIWHTETWERNLAETHTVGLFGSFAFLAKCCIRCESLTLFALLTWLKEFFSFPYFFYY